MKIIYTEGNRKSVEEMDCEAQDAVKKALELVEGKTGFRTYHETWRDCYLEICIGHNIYTTSIEIRPFKKYLTDKRRKWHNGCAYFCNGVFWASISRIEVELI
jgi:hypothetical protein